MKPKKKFIILMITAVIVITCAIPLLFPVVDVNVVFDRCINNDELATVFHNTSFKVFQIVEMHNAGSSLTITNNSELLGTPLEGASLESALAAEPQSTGIAVIDGCVSLIDISKIEESPFVDCVIIYFPILDGGDRDILAESTQRFYENNPKARYWE